ncbi:hypothetical protein [Anaerosporobacter faecicola]|uniref:hypothetical protein n=1 Tax=Anaerosporobacter faecicola TaxID=2718714 RepID=UPI00143A969D|nr:hypothetical protein [Anaerosporobacter faecicola]
MNKVYFLKTEQTFENMLILGNAYDIIGIKVWIRKINYFSDTVTKERKEHGSF